MVVRWFGVLCAALVCLTLSILVRSAVDLRAGSSLVHLFVRSFIVRLLVCLSVVG